MVLRLEIKLNKTGYLVEKLALALAKEETHKMLPAEIEKMREKLQIISA
jgi:hypothetical protein